MIDIDEELKRYATRIGGGIENSKIFLSLFTKNYKEDPGCALQLGIAMMLDKPIGIMAEEGVVIPYKLAKVAEAIAWFKPGDEASMEESTKELMAMLEDRVGDGIE